MSRDPKLAMRKVATSVSVLLVKDKDSVKGCTISSLIATEIRHDSFEVLFVLRKNSSTGRSILNIKDFSINVLADSMTDLASQYSKEREEHPLEALPSHILMRYGTPVLEDALTRLNCHLTKLFQFEESNLFIARVEEFDTTESNFPLIYYNRNYRKLNP